MVDAQMPQVKVDPADLLAMHEWLKTVEAAAEEVKFQITRVDAGLPARVVQLPLRQAPRRAGDPVPEPEPPVPTEFDDVAEARQVIGIAVCALAYGPLQDKRASVRLPGVFAASYETQLAIRRLNAAKDRFRAIASTLSYDQLKLLRLHGTFARLHTVQAYRHLPLLESRPVSVALSWHTGMAKRETMSVSQARAYVAQVRVAPGRHVDALEPEHDRVIEGYLATLAELPDDELLAVRRPLTASPQINWRDADEQLHTNSCAMPAAYPHVRGLDVLPAFTNHLGNAVPETVTPARRRGDYLFEEPALIPKLHLYRFLPGMRRFRSADPNARDPRPTAEPVSIDDHTLRVGPANAERSFTLSAPDRRRLVKLLRRAPGARGPIKATLSIGQLRVARGKRGIHLRLYRGAGELAFSGRMSEEQAAQTVAAAGDLA